MKCEGSFVALITPFTNKGRVDVQKIEKLVRWHLSEGTEGIICTGSTGESASLTEQDRSLIIRACVEAAEGKIPIVAGTGTSDTRQSVQLTEQAQKLGVEGAMIIVPYFNKPTQRGCLLHFQELSRVGLPLIVYNNPGRCAVNLLPETIVQIAQLPNIIALKESNGDLCRFAKIRSLTSLPLLAGDDLYAYEMLQGGAVGAVSVIGNLLPRFWSQMIHLATTGDGKKAKVLFEKMLPLLKVLSLEPNPQPIKKALELMRKCDCFLRLPLIEPTEEVTQKIRSALLELLFSHGFLGTIKTVAKGSQ